jgi:hypothetical protein
MATDNRAAQCSKNGIARKAGGFEGDWRWKDHRFDIGLWSPLRTERVLSQSSLGSIIRFDGYGG